MAGGLGWAFDRPWLAAGGLVVATALAGAFAVFLIVSERRRHESTEGELQAQAAFLESLVDSIAAVSSSLDPDEILERTCAEGKQLFKARSVRLAEADESTPDPTLRDGSMTLPLAVRGQPMGALVLERDEPFHRWDVIRATVLADFAARAVENARLLLEAREREAERSALADRLITAEQDERRRLSLFLHDGPVQSMSGIALMHDAALAAIRDGRHEDAAKIIDGSLQRERDTIRELRDLSFAIEPLVLRDMGFDAAVQALGDQIAHSYRVQVEMDVEAGEQLGEKSQVALYQVIREALNHAMRREPRAIGVTLRREGDGYALVIADNGRGERRRTSIEALEERIRILHGTLSFDTGDEQGTTVRVTVPAYATTPSN